MTVRIMIGLPASGKTTFCSDFMKKNKYCVHYVGETALQSSFFDNLRQNVRKPMLSDDLLEKHLRQLKLPNTYTVLIDGLFLTTKRVDLIIRCFPNGTKIILDYWPEDKEECMRNDFMRRRKGSSLTIKELNIEVDFDLLRTMYPVKVCRHTVYHTPDYALFFRSFYENDQPEDEAFYCSDSWRTGGETWGCGTPHCPIDPDEPPVSFTELESLLERICPELPMTVYRKIYDECVTVESKEESDYYSCISYAFYKCDMEALYKMLMEYMSGKIPGYAKMLSPEEQSLLDDIRDKECPTAVEELCIKLAEKIGV